MKQEGTPIYTESAYRAGQLKARGAIVADFLTEIQATESRVMRLGELWNPPLKVSERSDDYRDGFLMACQYLRVRLEEQHNGATREAHRLIGKATGQAFALAQCAHALLELAQENDE